MKDAGASKQGEAGSGSQGSTGEAPDRHVVGMYECVMADVTKEVGIPPYLPACMHLLHIYRILRGFCSIQLLS